MMKKLISAALFAIVVLVTGNSDLQAAKLTDLTVLDQEYLMVYYVDGEVKFKDDGNGPDAFGGHTTAPGNNWVVKYGSPLDVDQAKNRENWLIVSEDDPAYQGQGRHPIGVYRKTKITGMAQLTWNTGRNDYNYEAPLGHMLYLQLPFPLQQGKKYRLVINSRLDPSAPTRKFTFGVFTSRSEAIHINLVGYMNMASVKTADVYHWMGDGGPRDYSAFTGNKVYLYNIDTGAKQEVGPVAFWKKQGRELHRYDLTGSDVWMADFSACNRPGTYRIAIEGIGCSQDFKISKTIYKVPYDVSIRGFYYMRIGEDRRNDITPVPRRPLYIPGKSPEDTKVYITTMHPYHPQWKTFADGDKWDKPNGWREFRKKGDPVNPNAWGGHSDALDWDRHLGHVTIIYDMLLPYFLTDGVLSDDDSGISESGNGIPDILDEARNEVDFWLRLRDGDGYSHGLTNPNKKNELYQAANTVVAAWANAANAAMLADCFRIAGNRKLMKTYQGHAETAYAYASSRRDQQLNKSQPPLRGLDFKMTAAAYLYNVTGNTAYEKAVNQYSLALKDDSEIHPKSGNQLWGTAAYLLTPSKVHYPGLQQHMKKAVIFQARKKEADYSRTRPSRRSTDKEPGYFRTAQNVHRTLLAHRITNDPKEKQYFLDALVLEADWGLGRNALNIIQMTTATTPLEKIRSIENAYTSGRNDGTPGMHPGHTPYLNTYNWGRMIMASPRWMTDRGYPTFSQWPAGECYFNTRWVWAHSEFTPQQTMRGKMALYGYLYGISLQGRGRIHPRERPDEEPSSAEEAKPLKERPARPVPLKPEEPQPPEMSAAARELRERFKVAETAFIEGDLERAMGLFQAVVEEGPDSEEAEKARAYLAILD